MALSPESQPSLKRDHDSFSLSQLEPLIKPFSADSQFVDPYASQTQDPAAPLLLKSETMINTSTNAIRQPDKRDFNGPGIGSTVKTEPAGPETSSWPTKYNSTFDSPAGPDVHTSKKLPHRMDESPFQGPGLLLEPGSTGRRSSTSSLSEVGSSRRGDSPAGSQPPVSTPTPKSAFDSLKGVGVQPASKRVRLSSEEKARREEEKRLAAEEKKRQKDEEKRLKDEEKRVKDEEKKKQKDEERRLKEVEKQKLKDEEKRLKEEEKRLKEEEKQRLEDEKERKNGRQVALTSFFGAPKVSKEPRTETIKAATVVRVVDQMFPPFFKQQHVTLAPQTRFERDEVATRKVEETIDSYLLGNRSPYQAHGFDAASLLHLSGQETKRGIQHMSVKEIMADYHGQPSRPIDLTTDSQNSQIQKTHELLKKIPVKYLSFYQDVRPPYRGTYTKRPMNGIKKLSRNPFRRDLPNTDYDYDSEAEWQEGEEEGEDLDDDGDDDEMDLDDAEDMDGFLDDEGAESANSKRLELQGDLVPISTGLCWEDHHKKSTNVKMMPYRMEIILGKVPCCSTSRYTVLILSDHDLKSIDPLSTSYWEPVPVKTLMDPPRKPLNQLNTGNFPMNNTLNTHDAAKSFFSNASNPSQNHVISVHPTAATGGKAKPEKPKKMIPVEHIEAFRNAVRGSNLTKIGIVEVLKKQFPDCTGAQVKETLNVIARRAGKTEKEKLWVLNDEENIALARA